MIAASIARGTMPLAFLAFAAAGDAIEISTSAQVNTRLACTQPDTSTCSLLVTAPRDTWMRIHFGDYELPGESSVEITAVADGDRQVLTDTSLPYWSSTTGYFVGYEAVVKLNPDPGGAAAWIDVESVTSGHVENPVDAVLTPTTVPEYCETDDSRDPIVNARVGRLRGSFCTGWLVSNGAVLSAGHCASPAGNIFEVNIRESSCSGEETPSLLIDQYPVLSNTRVDGGVGNDWAVIRCGPNSETGLLPGAAQMTSYRMTRAVNMLYPKSGMNDGCGIDSFPDGCDGSPFNSRNLTLQRGLCLITGKNLGETSISHTAFIDGGSSGSPIILAQEAAFTLGINTHKHCEWLAGDEARGTSFDNGGLEAALQSFPGNSVTYVDWLILLNWPQGEDGTIFRPFNTLAEGLSAVTDNGTLAINRGNYSGSYNLGGDGGNFVVVAPVGGVIIGQ